jgi:hypothetical protein
MSGWPELDEVKIFGREVLPLVREAEENMSEARTGAGASGVCY